MKEAPNPPPAADRTRFRYRLSSLFALTTVVAFVLAYPRFAIGSIALFAGVVVALCGFVALIYYPIVRIAHRLSKRDRPDADDSL